MHLQKCLTFGVHINCAAAFISVIFVFGFLRRFAAGGAQPEIIEVCRGYLKTFQPRRAYRRFEVVAYGVHHQPAHEAMEMRVYLRARVVPRKPVGEMYAGDKPLPGKLHKHAEYGCAAYGRALVFNLFVKLRSSRMVGV